MDAARLGGRELGLGGARFVDLARMVPSYAVWRIRIRLEKVCLMSSVWPFNFVRKCRIWMICAEMVIRHAEVSVPLCGEVVNFMGSRRRQYGWSCMSFFLDWGIDVRKSSPPVPDVGGLVVAFFETPRLLVLSTNERRSLQTSLDTYSCLQFSKGPSNFKRYLGILGLLALFFYSVWHREVLLV